LNSAHFKVKLSINTSHVFIIELKNDINIANNILFLRPDTSFLPFPLNPISPEVMHAHFKRLCHHSLTTTMLYLQHLSAYVRSAFSIPPPFAPSIAISLARFHHRDKVNVRVCKREKRKLSNSSHKTDIEFYTRLVTTLIGFYKKKLQAINFHI
jgi:hypothetical protein